MIPGEIIPAKAAIELNTPNNSLKLKVANLGDRPIQVGSHFHFFELQFVLQQQNQKSLSQPPHILYFENPSFLTYD